MERAVVASGVVSDKVGEMMWEKLYIEWAMTTRGGRLSEEAAIAQWKTWEGLVLKKDPSVNFDYKGPSAKLRLWVHTADTLTFRRQYMHEQELACGKSTIKKPEDADLLRLRSEVLRGHAYCAGAAGSSVDFDDVARNMCINGGDVFSGIDGFVGSVLDLARDADDEDDEEEAVEEEAAFGDGKGAADAAVGYGDGPKASPAKRAKQSQEAWIDRDRVVSSTVRAVASAMKVFEVKAKKQLAGHEKFLEEWTTKAEEEVKNAFAGEVKVFQNRVETLKLVVGSTDADKLKEFLAQFSASLAPAAGFEGEETGQLQAVELGRSPPCERYLELKPLDVLIGMTQQYQSCVQQCHIKEVTNRISNIKVPIQTLLTRAAQAEKALAGAAARLKKDKEKLEKEAASKSKAAGASSSIGCALHDQGVQLAKRLPTSNLSEMPSIRDWSQPMVILAQTWVEEFTGEGHDVKKASEDFEATFSAAAYADKTFRASRPIAEGTGALRDKVFDAMGNMGGLIKSLSCQELDNTLNPSIFGIGESYSKASSEYCGVACFRLTISGTRSVAMTSCVQLASYMTRKGVQGRMTQARMHHFFRSMNHAALKTYADECSLWSATLGRGDMLYLPYGMVVSEHVQARTLGLRFGLAIKAPADTSATNAIKRRIGECTLLPGQKEDLKKNIEDEKKLLKELEVAFASQLVTGNAGAADAGGAGAHS